MDATTKTAFTNYATVLVGDALYEIDPVRLGCKENGLYDEYIYVASMIVTRIVASDFELSVGDSLKGLFETWGLLELVSPEDMSLMIQAVEEILINVKSIDFD